MLKPVKISIIVPVFNADFSLKKCIDSILSQTFTDFELLLIDDGSTDQSGNICDSYAAADRRIKAFHQVNKGVSAARNKGLEEATGEYTIFIDSDDYIENRYLDAFFLTDAHPKNALIIQGFTKEFRGGEIRQDVFPNKMFLAEDFSALFSMELIKRTPFPFAKLFDTKLIKKYKIRFNTDIHLGEDLIFILNYFHYLDKCILIDKCFYHYSYTEGSLTYKFNSYDSEIHRYYLVKDQLESLYDKFNLTGAVKTFHKSYIPIFFLRALQSLYVSPHKRPRNERINILKKHINNDSFLLVKDYFLPMNKREYVFKILFSNRMYIICDIYLSLITNLRQRIRKIWPWV